VRYLGYTLSIVHKIMNKSGQSIIEYLLITILVIIGVVVMGPYVIRSTNAHFKLWDEGIQDSYKEHITQASRNDVPAITSNCVCTDTMGDCGNSGAGSQCAATERVWNHNCVPQYCDEKPSSFCKYDPGDGTTTDPGCCVKGPNGCGNFPLPINTTTGLVDISLETTAQNPPVPPQPGNCYYGQQIIASQCGANASMTCQPSTSCPGPSCLGILPTGIAVCGGTGSTQDSNLDRDYSYTYSLKCDSITKCQYIWNPCLARPFTFPRPQGYWTHSFQGDNWDRINPNGTCAAYGFPWGGWAEPSNRGYTISPPGTISTEGFSNGPYGNDYFINFMNQTTGATIPPTQQGSTYTYTNAQIASSVATGQFPFSFNGYTAGWDFQGGDNSWTDVYCYQSVPHAPDPDSIDTAVQNGYTAGQAPYTGTNPSNATMCPNNPVAPTYTSFVAPSFGTVDAHGNPVNDGNCDYKTKNTTCQAYCNPGYTNLDPWGDSAVFGNPAMGPCTPNICKGPSSSPNPNNQILPSNSTLCPNGGALPQGWYTTPYSQVTDQTHCDGSSPCQTYCNRGYCLDLRTPSKGCVNSDPTSPNYDPADAAYCTVCQPLTDVCVIPGGCTVSTELNYNFSLTSAGSTAKGCTQTTPAVCGACPTGWTTASGGAPSMACSSTGNGTWGPLQGGCIPPPGTDTSTSISTSP